ncbi:MAG: patatin-like phospholipase family protein [Pseudomonadota bacterium]
MDFRQVYAEEPPFQGDEGEGRAEAGIDLAFSGGGIRSATFNLGVLQGMARRGLLKHVDYLSTVSGGGYIGAWYMAFLKRQAGNDPAQAERLLAPQGQGQANGAGEHPSITWLRRFSNYLTPKTGLSGDTLTLVATYLRNLLLNLIVILACLGAVLLLPRLLAAGMPAAHASDWLPLWAILPLLAAVAAIVHLLRRVHQPAATGAAAPRRDRQIGVLALVVLPVLVSAYFMSVGIASPGYLDWAAGIADRLPLFGGLLPKALAGSLTLALAYLLPWLLLGLAELARTRRLATRPALVTGLSALGASLLAGAVFHGLAVLAHDAAPSANELATAGPPLVLLAYLLPVTLHIGLARRRFSDMQREWWARLGGWLLALALAWGALSGIALFGPVALDALGDWAAGGGLAWLSATVWGVLAGKGSSSGKAGAGGMREAALRLVPWVFLIGLLGLLSLGLQKGLERAPPAATATQAAPLHASFTLDLAADGRRYTLAGAGSQTADGAPPAGARRPPRRTGPCPARTPGAPRRYCWRCSCCSAGASTSTCSPSTTSTATA